MKKTKFTEAQIVFALRPTGTGVSVAEVCRKMSIRQWDSKLKERLKQG